MTKIKKAILEIISSVLLGAGIIFMSSPFLLNWWIHGSYERYLWIISGPDPYNKFGGCPYQLVMYSGLLFIGIIAITSAFLLRRFCNKKY